MKLTLKHSLWHWLPSPSPRRAVADTAQRRRRTYGLVKQNACTVKQFGRGDVQDVAPLFYCRRADGGDKDFTIELENCDANVYEVYRRA